MRALLFLTLCVFFAPLSAQADLFSVRLRECMAKSEQAPDQTVAEAQRWVKEDVNSRDARLCLAFAYFERGDYTAAAERFTALAETGATQGEKAALHNKAGWAFLRAKQNDRAEEEFSRALEQQPDKAAFWTDRGVACMQADRYWDAVADFKESLKRDDKNPDTYAYMAQAWMKLDQPTRAEQDLMLALGYKPDHELATELALQLQERKKLDDKSELEHLMEQFE